MGRVSVYNVDCDMWDWGSDILHNSLDCISPDCPQCSRTVVRRSSLVRFLTSLLDCGESFIKNSDSDDIKFRRFVIKKFI